MITVLEDRRAVRNKRDKDEESFFNCSCKSDNK